MSDEVARLFRELADLSPAERRSYLDRAQAPADVRAEVESLLEFDSPTALPISQLVASEAEDLVESGDTAMEGRRCGPYRLVRLLGRGGAGAVFLGERADGQLEQRVAIKLLRHGRPTLRDRFLQERQILSTLNHAGIAHLLDAGETADGKPYLVMEYIDGTPIDVFAAKLDLRGKLQMFLMVCDAVSYAHRSLVIHRDLKPSNILVDGAGAPKLLDFGIAKILDAATDRTRTQERMLTPEFASPEQVRGTAQTTATDIYSLGAVLYQLLTGQSPHSLHFTTAEAMTPEAIYLAICTREAPAASSLNPALPRDLDFILRRALRKEPEERYVSVEALADDIRAFLDWRPVRARSGNAWYRTRKFVRRYWVPVTTATLTLVSLTAGLYVANRERLIAQRRFHQLHQLSSKIFDLDRDIRNLPGATKARHGLVSASLEYLEGLRHDARTDLDLAQEVAAAYVQVADIQGVPLALNLGEFDKAGESLKKAEDLIERVLASRPANVAALRTSAEIATDRMILASSAKRDGDALAFAVKAADRLERSLAQGDPSAEDRRRAAQSFVNIALAQQNMHRYQDAARYAQRSAQLTRGLPNVQRLEAAGRSIIASALRSQGRLEEALEAASEARALAERPGYGPENERAFNLYGVLLRQARLLGQDGGINLNRPGDAIPVYQKAVDITEQAASRDPNDQSSRDRLATCARELADILADRDPRRSLALFDLATRRLREVKNNLTARRHEAQLMAESSYPLRVLRRHAEARQRIDAAFALLRETKDYPAAKINPESEVVVALRALADYEADVGDRRRAVAIYEQMFEAMMATKPDPLGDLMDANKVSMMYQYSANVYRRAGEAVKADGMDARRLALWRHWDGKLPRNVFVQRQLTLPRN